MGFTFAVVTSSFSWSRCLTCIRGQPKLEELLREETWSACSTGFSIIPYLCWHRYLYNCTMKLASQEQFSWKQTKQQQQVSSPKAMAFSRATSLFIQLCPPTGLEKEVKVTAVQKDGYLPFFLLNGLKCSWDNVPKHWLLGPQQGWREAGGWTRSRDLGHGECPWWAELGEIIDWALHLQEHCLETSQALAKSGVVCETPKLLTVVVFPFQVPSDESQMPLCYAFLSIFFADTEVVWLGLSPLHLVSVARSSTEVKLLDIIYCHRKWKILEFAAHGWEEWRKPLKKKSHDLNRDTCFYLTNVFKSIFTETFENKQK